MSLDIVLKVGVGVLGASLVSFGGYELHNYLVGTLEQEYTLLDEKNEKWNALVTAYESINGDNLDSKPKKMQNFDFDSSEASDKDAKKERLINHCKTILKTSLRIEKEELNKRREEIETWCISEATAMPKQANLQ